MATIIKGKNLNRPYTVRYFHDGKQREKSFRTAREARDFKAKFEYDSRENIFVDPRVANTKFADVAAGWLSRHPGTPKTKETYELNLRRHILPVFGDKGLGALSRDRDGVEMFLRETLPAKGLGASTIRTCYMIMGAIVNDAIRTGKLGRSTIRGIRLPVVSQKADIPFATRQQVEIMADAMPGPYAASIYFMRGCGLRLGEALGVRADDFGDGSPVPEGTLRLARQLSPDGKMLIPLKHRSEDDFRDIPVPGYVITHGADVPVAQVSHRQYRDWFNRARDAAGLPKEFTPHTLRHIFASVCLAGGVPITDVSKWLGHRSIQVTYGIYGHLVPASWDRARGVLEEEWAA